MLNVLLLFNPEITFHTLPKGLRPGKQLIQVYGYCSVRSNGLKLEALLAEMRTVSSAAIKV